MIHWRKHHILSSVCVPAREREAVLSNQPPYDQPPYNPQYPPSGGYPPQQPGGYYPPSGGYPPQQPGGYYPAPEAYQQAQPYGYPGAPVAQPETGGGFAIAGLILGIVSIPISVFAICGYITAVLGLIFSILGRRAPSKRMMATIGIVLSILGFIAAIISSVFGVMLMSSQR
jgi:hypothetical protein